MRKAVSVLVTVMVMLVSVTGSAAAFTVADAHAPQVEQPTTAENETTTTTTTTPESNETNQSGESVAPGVMLAGSIGVHQAEIHGEVEHRAFGLQVANAASNDSRAQVLNHTQAQLQDRLADAEERKQALNESLADGEITQAQYDIAMSKLSTQTANIERLANSSETVAHDLPEETLRANGVNVTALEQIRTNARHMSGQEVSELARQIGGGHGMGVSDRFGPPEDTQRGPPTDNGDANETESDDDDRMGPHMGGDDDDRQRGPPTEDAEDIEDADDGDDETTTTTTTTTAE